MSHVRINPWAEAPIGQRRAFGRKRRQWIAHIPEGCELGEVNWEKRLTATLDDGSMLIAGNEPRPKAARSRRPA